MPTVLKKKKKNKAYKSKYKKNKQDYLVTNLNDDNFPQIKRPRGRPPLQQSIITSSKGSIKHGVSSSSVVPKNQSYKSLTHQHTNTMKLVQSIPLVHNITSDNNINNPYSNICNTATSSGLSNIVNSEVVDVPKVHRPSYYDVTNKILSTLMIKEPLSLLDIFKQFTDIPKEYIQNVLEVLQTMGIVIQLQSNDSTTKKDNIYYTIIEYSKFNTIFPFTQIPNETKCKLENLKIINNRIKILEELTLKDITPEVRFNELYDIIHNYSIDGLTNSIDCNIKDEILYKSLIQLLDINFRNSVYQ